MDFFWWFYNSKFHLPYRLYPPIFTSVLKETLLVKMNYSWSTQPGTHFNIPIEAKKDGNVLVFPIKSQRLSLCMNKGPELLLVLVYKTFVIHSYYSTICVTFEFDILSFF